VINPKNMDEKLFADFNPMDAKTWSDLITKELKGESIDSLLWQTQGVNGKAFYTSEDLPADLPQLQFENEHPESEGSRHWVNYQVIEVQDEKMANEKALHALNSGATGLLFKVQETPNLSLLLKDVLLPYCHISFESAGDSQVLLNALEEFLHESGCKSEDIKGFILGEKMSFSKNLINYKAATKIKKHNNVCLELACILAQAIDALDETGLTQKDLPLPFRQLQFTVQLGESYFREVAKHRALRLLVSRLASTYGFEINTNAIDIASYSGDWNEPTQDEYNYLLRASTQAMSAIIGGTNGLIIQPFYQLFSKNSAQAERMARNISILLKDESYFDKAIDPAAGSYFIESLTLQMVEKSWRILQTIEEQGGLSQLSENEIDALTQNETA
jgi:methylmalonyl-CoA mutase